MAKRSRWYTTKEFQAQREEWYAKLAEEGFQDLEMHNPRTGEPSRNLLKGLSASVLGRRTDRRGDDGAEEYYRLARQHVHRLRGPARGVWALYSEGWEPRRIYEMLKGRMPITFRQIEAIVRDEEAAMMKDWSEHEKLSAAELRAAVQNPFWRKQIDGAEDE
jgi:hypothetical protein